MADGDMLNVASGHQELSAKVLGSADIADALLGADSPSAANPFTTGLAVATKTLTSVQILDLHQTPITVVPAVPGKTIVTVCVWAYFNAVTTPYTCGGDEDLNIGVGGGAINAQFNQDVVSSLLGNGTDGTWAYAPALALNDTQDNRNTPLEVLLSDSVTDGDGTLTLKVLYFLA